MVRDVDAAIVTEAEQKLAPATLHRGRETVQVGFKPSSRQFRRLHLHGGNRDGPVVPWVDVLTRPVPRHQKANHRTFRAFRASGHCPQDSNLASTHFPGRHCVADSKESRQRCHCALWPKLQRQYQQPSASHSHANTVKSRHLPAAAILKTIRNSNPIIHHHQTWPSANSTPRPLIAARSPRKTHQRKPRQSGSPNTAEPNHSIQAKNQMPACRFDVNGLMLGNE